ncbi:MAG: recombination mediator RecR [Phycisphaerae bacterium]
MSSQLTGPLQRLIESFQKLPGIGARSAERIAFHLLKASREEAVGLAEAIRAVKEKVRPCAKCFNLAESELCHICADGRRDAKVIVVVEQPKDLINLEATGVINGVYHVLMGRVAPLDGIEPKHLTIDALVKRVTDDDVREVILATNPTVEGDTTALHIQEALEPLNVSVTRLARGIAPGSQIEYANRSMLEEAFRGRKSM